MATIVWDKLGDRTYEVGLDHGVLYFPGGGGVPWNGLVSFIEKVSTTVEPVYFDGTKYNDIVTVGDFAGVLRAFTYPEEFLEFEGVVEDQTGMFLTGQPPKPFHLTYRTKIGSDTLGLEAGYKIHILWNLLAVASAQTHSTLALDTEPGEFEWSISSVPEDVELYRPTSYIVIDSRKMDPLLLSDVEDILYGTADTDPRMPSLKGLTSFIRKWDRLIITDNDDGTWTATSRSEGIIEMLDATTFQITGEEAEYLDPETYTLTSSNKNEEDIF